ncbi:MAG: nucleotide pyrophosphohydrolase [Prochloraceae cyanobacterium]
MRQEHNKLVRDNIPEIIEREEKKYKCKILSQSEFIAALKSKIIEEAQEIAASSDREELIQEVADLYEAVDTLLSAKQIEREKIIKAKQEKQKAKGGFQKRIKLIWTEE